MLALEEHCRQTEHTSENRSGSASCETAGSRRRLRVLAVGASSTGWAVSGHRAARCGYVVFNSSRLKQKVK
jgi:hypothetical protein